MQCHAHAGIQWRVPIHIIFAPILDHCNVCRCRTRCDRQVSSPQVHWLCQHAINLIQFTRVCTSRSAIHTGIPVPWFSFAQVNYRKLPFGRTHQLHRHGRHLRGRFIRRTAITDHWSCPRRRLCRKYFHTSTFYVLHVYSCLLCRIQKPQKSDQEAVAQRCSEKAVDFSQSQSE